LGWKQLEGEGFGGGGGGGGGGGVGQWPWSPPKSEKKKKKKNYIWSPMKEEQGLVPQPWFWVRPTSKLNGAAVHLSLSAAVFYVVKKPISICGRLNNVPSTIPSLVYWLEKRKKLMAIVVVC
jgi:hypothetical protein